MRYILILIGIGGAVTVAYANAYATGGDRIGGMIFGAFVAALCLYLALTLKP